MMGMVFFLGLYEQPLADAYRLKNMGKSYLYKR